MLRKDKFRVLSWISITIFLATMACNYLMIPNTFMDLLATHKFANTSWEYTNKIKGDEPLQFKLHDSVFPNRSQETKLLQNSSLHNHEVNLTSLLLQRTNELNLNKALTVTNKIYVCAKWDLGGLGNKLYIYASLYGITKKTNTTFVIEENAEIRNYFKYLKAEIIPQNSKICQDVTYVSEKESCCSFDPAFYNFAKNRNVKQTSYLQSYYYFKDVEDDIREQFTFKDEIVITARQRILQALNDNRHNYSSSEIVGVHVRLGDKLDYSQVAHGNVVASAEFYNRAMNYFRMELKNPIFIIVMSWNRTEDIMWVKQHMTGDDIVLLGSNPLEVDLCALTLCNHTIMSIGTFGWWGAWLCNGTTIYCKDFAAKGSNLAAMYSKDLKFHFPPNWIGM